MESVKITEQDDLEIEDIDFEQDNSVVREDIIVREEVDLLDKV